MTIKKSETPPPLPVSGGRRDSDITEVKGLDPTVGTDLREVAPRMGVRISCG